VVSKIVSVTSKPLRNGLEHNQHFKARLATYRGMLDAQQRGVFVV